MDVQTLWRAYFRSDARKRLSEETTQEKILNSADAAQYDDTASDDHPAASVVDTLATAVLHRQLRI